MTTSEEEERSDYEQEIQTLKARLAEKEHELAQYQERGEGQLKKVSIGHDIERKRVVVEFGVPLRWFTLSSIEARGLAALITEHASHADGKDH
jgi:hypothetical protein